MKLTYSQLEQHLKKELNQVYVICGEEPFLVQESLDLIRQKVQAAGFTDRMRLDMETDRDWENSYSYAYTTPLLSNRRLLELHCKGGTKLTKSGHLFLKEYVLHPSPHTLLLLRLGKLDSKIEQTQWFKSLEQNSIVISIWPLPQKQLPSWIMQKAKTKHLHFTPEAAQLLAHYVEGNLQAAAQEIEKLSLGENTTIDRKMIEDFVTDQGCFSSFDLVYHALTGNNQQVLRILQYLQNEGTEPLLVLGAYTHELRIIAKLAKDLKKGASLATLFQQHHIRIPRQAPIRDFLRRCPYENCLNLLLKAGEIDRLAKGALPGNIWETLQELSLEMAGSKLGPSN